MNEFKQKISEYLSGLLEKQITAGDLSTPPTMAMGDFAFPCFTLAKEQKKSPVEVAKDLVAKIQLDFVEKIEAAGPYVNFFIKDSLIAEKILNENVARGADPTGERVMFEYSQPNTHKEFHVGHLRNACLGASLVNMSRYLGHDVVAANYIGDTGVHVAKCLWNLTKFHSSDNIPENKGEFLGNIYSEAVAKLSENKDLEKEVSAIQAELEKGSPDSELVKLWQETKEWSLDSFRRIYDLLGIKFDVWFWESEEEIAGRALIEKILAENKIPEIKKSEGALIADLREYGLEVLVLIKSDGNVLYGTKDLPLGKKKFDNYELDRSVYIVDNRQSLYIKQIFKLLDLLGYENKQKYHVAHDFVTLPEGAMASRKGNVITLENFYEEVFLMAREETKKRHTDWTEDKLNRSAKFITLAAVKFWMLKYDNNSVIVFEKEKALAFDGDTGPYLLYTIARLNSILNQPEGKLDSGSVNYDLLIEESEKRLMRHMAAFAETVALATTEYSPSRLATYLLQLAQNSNTFYHNCPVLKADEELKNSRLALIEKAKAILIQGLELLNITCLDEM
jgi:arginyl-tRNA synthetase